MSVDFDEYTAAVLRLGNDPANAKDVAVVTAHASRLVELQDRLGQALFDVLRGLHRTYGSTAGPYGGIGGQAITTFCFVDHAYDDEDQGMEDNAEAALNEWLIKKAKQDVYPRTRSS